MKLPSLAKSEANGVILLAILLLSVLSAFAALNRTVVKTSAAVSPYIAVVPTSTVDQAITPGMNYTVSIYTNYDGDDVWGYEFKLAYNPDVLKGVEVVNGDLITGGTASFIPGEFNNTAGELRLTLGFFFWMSPPPPLTSGPGILANVTFNVVDFGKSTITLETDPDDPDRTKLKGYYYNATDDEWLRFNIIDAWTMPDHIQHGFFGNAPDVAVTDVTPSVVEAKPGTTVDINVDVANIGPTSETFNVTTYYNLTEIDTTLVSLAAGENTTLGVAWNTTDVTEGNYTISAYAWPVLNEADTSDNTYVNGEVMITAVVHDVAVIDVAPSANAVQAGELVNITVTVENKGTEIETFNVTAYYADNAIETKIVSDLASEAEEVLTFTWNTTGVAGGNYTIKATAELLGEVNVADNTFVDGEIKVVIHDIAVASVTPAQTQAIVGETVFINATVVNEGNVPETFNVTAYYDDEPIETKTNIALDGGMNTTVTFTWETAAIAAGTYTLKVQASVLLGETDTADNILVDGDVELVVHDVAVASITVSSETAEIGENITITVVVRNEGTETETFEVKTYRDATEIGAEDVNSLNAGAQSTLTFIWNTAGLEEGAYVIKAVAGEVTGETDDADNTKTYGTVTLSTPSPEGLPMEIVIAGILVVVAILAVVSYILLKRRKPSQG